MRLLMGLLLFAGIAAGDLERLHELADTRQIFLLREALQQPGWNKAETLFYRGMVESRFGQESKGIDDLTRFLANRPSPEDQRRAREELAAAFGRTGKYGDAARNLSKALRLAVTGDQTDTVNSEAVYAALADIPPQSAKLGKDLPVRAMLNVLGSWDVPVDVNGRRIQMIFDTGANWSVLSASEAGRLGLEIRDSDAYVRGATGKKNSLRLAVANDLQFGRARLKHVIFLVLPDDSLFVGPLKYQIRGILGLPVLRALGRVGIAANGDVRIEPGRTANGRPNLFFDGKEPVVEVRHNDRTVLMFLDTGANASSFYRSFRLSLTKDEIAALTVGEEQTGGAGEILVRKTEAIPMLHLVVSGQSVDLSDVSLLTTAPEGNARYRDGVLGTDALRHGFTLDFRAMQLRIE